jgi:hypothetical protein
MEKLKAHNMPQQTNANTPATILIPAGFRQVVGVEAAVAAHHLGYLREERFVIAAYHPEAEEVIWKEGRLSGFGEGGWDYYFHTLLPLAEDLQADLTDQTHIGQDVLVMDRVENKIYIAPRSCADEFLAIVTGVEPPHHRCLCARPIGGITSCDACPERHHDISNSTTGFVPKVDGGPTG